MWSPHSGSSRQSSCRRFLLWSGLAIGWLLPSVGWPVEYAGMTLPSGKDMDEGGQDFAAGPVSSSRWGGFAIGCPPPSAGCQVEYAGMTLPSGKYMHDDVQYFAPGPDFPWANTQAATQRARMQSMGMDAGPGGTGALLVPPAQGAINPIQNRMGRPTDINQSPLTNEAPLPDPGPGGAGAMPDAGAPAPGAVAPPPPGRQPGAPPAGPGGAAPR